MGRRTDDLSYFSHSSFPSRSGGRSDPLVHLIARDQTAIPNRFLSLPPTVECRIVANVRRPADEQYNQCNRICPSIPSDCCPPSHISYPPISASAREHE